MKRNSRAERWIKWIPALVILVIWQVGSGTFLNKANYSSPYDIVIRLIEDLSNGILLRHIGTTYYEVFWGLLVGLAVGGTLGYFSGNSQKVASIVEPYALLLNSIPKVAVAPLMIIWFGIGTTSKIVMAALLVFFVFFFNVFVAVRSINYEYIQIARIMGASKWDVIWRVVMPFIVPNVIVGVKQGIVFAVIGTLVSEFIASSQGIGYYIQSSTGSFDTTGVFVGVVILMITVLFVNALLDIFQSRFMKWIPKR